MLATGFKYKEEGWLCESRSFQCHSSSELGSLAEGRPLSTLTQKFFPVKSLFPVGFTLELYCSFSFPLSISPTLAQHAS